MNPSLFPPSQVRSAPASPVKSYSVSLPRFPQLDRWYRYYVAVIALVAASAITIEAAAEKNDLIIMGASERGLLESLVSGDPVEEVLRETPANLIILLPRLKAA